MTMITYSFIDGTPGNDILWGNDNTWYRDYINAKAGDDLIYSGISLATISGGEGSDTVSYEFSRGEVWVLLSGYGVGNAASGDTYGSIENAIGSAFGDTLIGDGAANRLSGLGGDDLLIGGLGIDRFDGGAGIDKVSYESTTGGIFVNLLTGLGFSNAAEGETYSGIEFVIGSQSADMLIGDGGGNWLYSGNGDDILVGGLGADALAGGAGIDTASYEDNWGAVSVDLNNGVGSGSAAQGDYLTGIENLTGGAFGDSFFGDGGVNRLDGAAGDDSLTGGVGADALIGGAGSDTASYADNWGAVFVNLSTGQGFGNAAEGDSLADIENLIGSLFADGLIGDGGVNRLDGGAGSDLLVGGGGGDSFAFSSALGSGNVDDIADFAAGADRIELSKAVFDGLALGSLAASAFVIGAQATDAAHRIVYDSGTGALYYDADGSGAGAAIQFAVLQPNLSLASTDFAIV